MQWAVKEHLLCTSQSQQALAEGMRTVSQHIRLVAASGESSGLVLDCSRTEEWTREHLKSHSVPSTAMPSLKSLQTAGRQVSPGAEASTRNSLPYPNSCHSQCCGESTQQAGCVQQDS